MADTINTFSLGSINSLDPDVQSNLTPLALPMSGTSSVIVQDYAGVERRIKIAGTLTAASLNALMTNISQLDLLQNGGQSNVVLHLQMFADAAVAGYYADGNFNVKVEHFNYHWEDGDTGYSVKYTLDVMESS
jgi:hypothetical protein